MMGERQKQVDEAIERALTGKSGKGKCRAVVVDGLWLVLYHYHHRLLVWELMRGVPIDTWWERDTDRRILRAALANLSERV
tara:strand:+ start:7771 stop:8013 length:243 start_codon:yes stop_codon:yes gene_type:complete